MDFSVILTVTNRSDLLVECTDDGPSFMRNELALERGDVGVAGGFRAWTCGWIGALSVCALSVQL